MIYAKCPECRCTRLLITRKDRGPHMVITFRIHHQREPNVELHERGKNPLCRGSGRPLPLGSSLTRL